eukprot:12407878-Karenia_brevis.AAC.1
MSIEIVGDSAGTQWIGSAVHLIANLRKNQIGRIAFVAPAMHADEFALRHRVPNKLKADVGSEQNKSRYIAGTRVAGRGPAGRGLFMDLVHKIASGEKH